MLRLGEKQELVITRLVSFGVYLASEDDRENDVLLPGKEVPEGAKKGDRLEVFLYKDSADRLIAPVREPLLTLGKTGLLTVKETGRIGAFLDWGLEKDLLLPFHEQTKRVREGEEVLAALYIDKSQRLCATMNVYPYLHVNAPYQIGDMVRGRIYDEWIETEEAAARLQKPVGRYVTFETAPVHSLEELKEFRDSRFPEIVDFYGVFRDEELLAGSMLFYFDNKVLHTQYLAQRADAARLFVMNYLNYHLIELAKEKGFESFSFGISTEERGKVLNTGLAVFKEGFGTQFCNNRSFYKEF